MKKVMKKIIVNQILETAHSDSKYIVEYVFEGKYGYEIIEWDEQIEKHLIEGEFNNSKILYNQAVNKPHVNTCSELLTELLEECRLSENLMWSCDYDDISEDSLCSLENEIFELGLEEYVEFGQYEVLVYGAAITKFLF